MKNFQIVYRILKKTLPLHRITKSKPMKRTAEEQKKINQLSLANIDYSKVNWEEERLRHEQMHEALQSNTKTATTMPTMEQMYEWTPNLKAHHEAQMSAVRQMQAKPVDWDEIRRQIDEDHAVHGQANPNRRK